jgi:hypothetical protein
MVKYITPWCFGYHGCGMCDGPCQGVPYKDSSLEQLAGDHVAATRQRPAGEHLEAAAQIVGQDV